MPTQAQQRLAALDRWFERNSRWGTTPNGHDMPVGQYAAIVPCSFAEPPPFADHHPDALPFYVSDEQSVGMTFADFDPAAPDSQRQGDERLEHCLFLLGDQRLPPVALVGLTSPQESIGAAIDRAGLAGADLAALPVLAVFLGALADGPRGRIAARLPFVPAPGATDPDMPEDEQPRFGGVREIWP